MELAVQTWSIRGALSRDVPHALNRLYELGYRNVEVASTGHRSPADFAEALSTTELKVMGTHEQSFGKGDDKIRRVIERARIYGARHVAIMLHDWAERSVRWYEEFASHCKSFATELAKHGLRLSFHPFSPDLEPLHNQMSGLDLVLEATDPDELGVQLDSLFVFRANLDLATTLLKYADRILTMHLNDCYKSGSNCALGKGVLQIVEFAPRILALPNLEWVIIEHDVRDPWKHLEDSLTFCKKVGLAGDDQ